MIDRDHARQLLPHGSEVKAAGWFTDYEVQEDGSIWGTVEWTRRGEQEVTEKEYKHFSATFAIDKLTREILYITGGTLTNTPNFDDMQALASKKQPSHVDKETTPMKPEIIALAKSLGLDHETHTEEQILAAAQARLDEVTGIEGDLASLKQSFKLSADADIDAIKNAATKVIEDLASAQKTDLNEFVPRAAYDEVASRVSELEKSVKSKAAEDVVEAAMKDGKVTPNMKSWAIEQASKDIESFKKFVESAPVIVGNQTAASQVHESEIAGLSSEDVEVAKQLGVDPKNLVKKGEDAA